MAKSNKLAPLSDLFDARKKLRKKSKGRRSADWSSIDSYESEAAILYNILEHSRQICSALDVPANTTVGWADLKEVGAQGQAHYDRSSKQYKVTLDSSIFKERTSSERYSDILDVYCGIAVHEAGHVNHSDLKNSGTLLRELDFYEHLFVQLLEDNRTEELSSQEAPGFVQYLEKLNAYSIEKTKPDTAFPKMDDLQKVISLVYMILRAPSELSEEMKDYVSPKGVKVFDSFLARAKKPVTLADTFSIGKDLRKWLDEVIDLPNDERLKPQGKMRSAGREAVEKILEKDEVLSKIIEAVKSIVGAGIGEKLKEEIKELEETVKADFFKDEEARTIPSIIKVAGKPTLENCQAYKREVASVRNYVNRLRQFFSFRLAQKTYKVNELAEGKLNRRMLARIPSGYDRMYYQTTTKNATGLAICLLLDGSGSMCGRSGSMAKIDVARKIAVLFVETLRGVPNVELEVYSYTSGGGYDGDGDGGRATYRDSLLTYLYGRKQPSKEIIGSYTAECENFDGVAIRSAAKLFKSATNNQNRLMIVISDGMPAGPSYHGDVGVEDTKKAVQEVSKQMEVFAIAIEDFNVSKMYKHSVKWTDLNSLIPNVGNKLKKVIQASTNYV